MLSNRIESKNSTESRVEKTGAFKNSMEEIFSHLENARKIMDEKLININIEFSKLTKILGGFGSAVACIGFWDELIGNTNISLGDSQGQRVVILSMLFLMSTKLLIDSYRPNSFLYRMGLNLYYKDFSLNMTGDRRRPQMDATANLNEDERKLIQHAVVEYNKFIDDDKDYKIDVTIGKENYAKLWQELTDKISKKEALLDHRQKTCDILLKTMHSCKFFGDTIPGAAIEPVLDYIGYRDKNDLLQKNPYVK